MHGTLLIENSIYNAAGLVVYEQTKAVQEQKYFIMFVSYLQCRTNMKQKFEGHFLEVMDHISGGQGLDAMIWTYLEIVRPFIQIEVYAGWDPWWMLLISHGWISAMRVGFFSLGFCLDFHVSYSTISWLLIQGLYLSLSLIMLFITCSPGVLSRREVYIWAWCQIFIPHNIPHCCSSCSILCICCEKANEPLSASSRNIHHGCCCCIHIICK